ncbi:sirohydrochlorin chelatase [Streptomyces spiramenti]|uniref:Sirohydrochlorin chelatase n=1 Tax=Streptomyces spiramenti TaxID=2720606 RepID=A0ABX1AFW1_9ACTN|nr:sirohydrochlorin chelatase [Streptomyces spiramenti]NJP65080.1 sirohydrochlorin chelatase [Streptomyces spiramenti]
MTSPHPRRGLAPVASRGPAPALLVVAHGSRDPRHAATVTALLERVRAQRPEQRVHGCYLDFTLPGPGQALERLREAGVREVVAVPLLLTDAYHAKKDIPEVLAAQAARPGAPVVRQAPVLGPDLLLTAALTRRLREVGVGPADAAGTGVVLAAAGSSDPEAIATVAATAREWRRTAGWCAVRPAFASASPPTTADAVRALRAQGVRRVAVAPYVLAPGRLPDRIARGAEEAGADVVAPVIGDCPELAELVLRRWEAGVAAPPVRAPRRGAAAGGGRG